MFKISILISLTFGIFSGLFAEPVVPRGDFSKKLNEQAGKVGEFINKKENFPKDYFLVHNNLPFLAGLSLHHPRSSSLKLTEKQIKAIQNIKKITVPEVVKKSKKIKKLELELANNIAIDLNTAKSQYALVEKIGKLRVELTKAHLSCINSIRDILTKEQYQKLLKYAKQLVEPKSNKFKIDELAFLPHPGKLIRVGKIVVSKEQKQKIDTEIKTVYTQNFHTKLHEALELEKKVQKMVSKGKTKKDVKDLLDKIAQLKREAIDSRIDALNHMQKIMTKEQWKKINKLTYK